ncbi:hypothetical protein D3C87_1858770 [compost metagenome]
MVTSAARTLLLVHLGTGARNFATGQCLMRALLLLGELVTNHTSEDVLAGVEAEDRVRQGNLASVFAFEGLDVEFHNNGSLTSQPT